MNKGRKRILATCIILALAAIIILVISKVMFNKNEPTYTPNDPRAMASRSEKLNKNSYQENLDKKDYESYQEGMLSLAYAFMEAKDYSGAQKRLDKITDNVPENKLNIHTYMALSEVAQKRNDTKKYKTYTTILIEKLNKDGRKAEAEQYSKELAKVQ